MFFVISDLHFKVGSYEKRFCQNSFSSPHSWDLGFQEKQNKTKYNRTCGSHMQRKIINSPWHYILILFLWKYFLIFLTWFYTGYWFLKPKKLKRITDRDYSVPGSYVPLSVRGLYRRRFQNPSRNITKYLITKPISKPGSTHMVLRNSKLSVMSPIF